MKKIFLLSIAFLFFVCSSQATYIPLPITSGYNADVIVNGVGSGVIKSTHDLDNVSYVLVAQGWQLNATSTPLTWGLPANGVINSAVTATPGLSFELAPYDSSNSLRLITNNSYDTLVFGIQASADTLFLLANTGSGSSSITGQIIFTDATVQEITTSTTGIIVPDWFYSTAQPVALSGFGRMNRTTNALEPSSVDPRLYQIAIPISAINQTKPIAAIRIVKSVSSAAAAVLNVYAASIKANNPCASPTALNTGIITSTSAELQWTQSGTASQWEIKYGINGFNLQTGGTSIYTNTNSHLLNPPLQPSTTYDFYVRTFCSISDTSFWSSVHSFTTLCSAPPTITNYTVDTVCGSGVGQLTATASSGTIYWYETPSGGTPLDTGTTFETPIINATKIYYAVAVDGCEGVRQAIEVFVKPTHVVNIGGDTTICSNTPITLDAGHSGPNTSYIWNTQSSVQTIQVSTSGKYYVEVSIEDCIASDTILVTVVPAPIVEIGNDTTVCSNVSLYLGAGNPGAKFLWSNQATTSTIVANAAGTYYVTVTNSNNCYSSDTIVISYFEAPEGDFTYTEGASGTFTFTAQATGAVEYTWDFGDGNTPVVTSNPIWVHIYNNKGNYKVKLTLKNKCGDTALVEQDLEYGVGIKNHVIKNDVFVYPNPATSGKLFIKNESGVKISACVITDALGRVIKEEALEVMPNSSIMMDVEQLSDGIYIVKIITEAGSVNSFVFIGQ